MKKAIFITGTDTGVGKTVVSFVLATLLKQIGIDVGIFKPVQCAGNDASFLKNRLNLDDPLNIINPIYLKHALSPATALRLEKKVFDKRKILKCFKELQKKHDVLIVEGAGGLLVPLKDNYFIKDLILELNLPTIIVARLGLGTINHTLLTVNLAKESGINVLGVILNQDTPGIRNLAQHSNPGVIKKLNCTPLLGILPHLAKIDTAHINRIKQNIDIEKILKDEAAPKNNWQEKDKRYIWHPFTQMKDWNEEEQLVIEEGKGNFLKATNGRWYLDGVSSLWVNVHGHRKPQLDEAIIRQLKKISHSTMLGLSNIPAIELAEKLVDIAPQNLSKVFYSDNGSTAVEIAIKICYQYWQNIGTINKKKFVHLDNSYHGDSIGAVSVGGIDLFHKVYHPLLFKTFSAPSPYCYRCSLEKSYPSCKLACLKKLEDLLEKHNKKIAALIIEPIVQAASGIIVWPKGALARIRKLCSRYDCLLIVDEVATGFGRTGKMFACEHEDVRPDILCVAKSISAGYLPLAATLTTEKIYNAFLAPYAQMKTFFHGHTYTGNALACAVSLANLDLFEKEKTIENLKPKIALLKKQLQTFKILKHVGDIRQLGLMVGVELVKDKFKKTPYAWEEKIGIKVCNRLREKGIILRPLGNVIVLMPPLAISRGELEFLIKNTFEAIKQITESGL
jgi:adenosylmethionine-8-amino-7-oxononanoate aminotransferase